MMPDSAGRLGSRACAGCSTPATSAPSSSASAASAASTWMFSSRLIPEFAEDGTVESVLSIASNITEQELIDAALRESKARLEFTLAAAHVGEWEIDVASGESRHSACTTAASAMRRRLPGWNLERALRAPACRTTASGVRALCRARVRDAHRPRVRGPRRLARRQRALDRRARQPLRLGARQRARKPAPALPGHHRGHHAAQAHRGHAARRRPAQGRVPRDARPRAAQPARADPQRAADHAAPRADRARCTTARARSSSASCSQMVHLVDDLLDVSRISQGKMELRLEQVDVADAVLDAPSRRAAR